MIKGSGRRISFGVNEAFIPLCLNPLKNLSWYEVSVPHICWANVIVHKGLVFLDKLLTWNIFPPVWSNFCPKTDFLLVFR